MRVYGGDLSYDESMYCNATIGSADCRQPIISDIGYCRAHHAQIVGSMPSPAVDVARLLGMVGS